MTTATATRSRLAFPAALARARTEAWSQYGWDDAAAFHAATFGQRFDPNALDELDYTDHYRQLLADPGPVGAQPTATKTTDGYGVAFSIPATATPRITVSEVLDLAAPINRFRQTQIAVTDLQAVLQRSVGAQRTVGGVVSDHLIKAHPSGGSRRAR